ncbi:MAG: ABC transporter ATP-binding protein, partial [Deltaproteobacteria bacterium]|nr:ABC transporter ATP-binding protein [Deltaproteobacteria bacterium]
PQDLFENPAHTFVGYFIGSPGMNFLECTLEGNAARVDGAVIPLDEETAALGRKAQGKLEVRIRPMYLDVRSEPGEAGVEATVTMIEDQGSYRIVTLMLGGRILRAKVPEGKPVSEDTVWVHFPKEWIRLFADGRVVT